MAVSNAFSNDIRATKVYAEIHCDVENLSEGKGGIGFGLATASMALDGVYVGFPSQSVGFYSDGSVYKAGSVATTSSSWGAGDWLGVQVDTTAQTVAFRNITTGGSWSSAVSLSGFSSPLYLVVTAAVINDAITANFDGDFVGAVPSGFTRWDGTAATPTGALAGTEASDTAAIAGEVAGGGEATQPPVYGGGIWQPPRLRPFPVEGVGYGILPELEGEAHGVVFIAGSGAAGIPHSLASEAAGAVGAGGHSRGRITIKAAATGARGATGGAAVVLGLGAAAGSGSVVVGGKGFGLINIAAAAGGQHDDDGDAVVVWLLAA